MKKFLLLPVILLVGLGAAMGPIVTFDNLSNTHFDKDLTTYQVTVKDGVYQPLSTTLDRLSGLGSGSPGDLIYRDSVGWSRLPIQADGFVLRLDGGFPAWVPFSGGGDGTSTGGVFVNNSEIEGANFIAGTGYTFSITGSTNISVSLSANLLGWNSMAPSAKQDTLPASADGLFLTRVDGDLAWATVDESSGFPLVADGDLAGFSLTGGNTLQAANIVAGSDNLVTLIGTKATPEDITDSFLFRGIDMFTVPSTNTAVKLNIQHQERTHPVSYPPVQYTGVNYAWDLMSIATLALTATGDVNVTFINFEEAAAEHKSGLELAITNSTAGPIAIELVGAFPLSDIQPTALGAGQTVTILLGFRFGQLTYSYDGPQAAILQPQYGGTGEPYGIARDGKYPVDSTGMHQFGELWLVDVNYGLGQFGNAIINTNVSVLASSGRISASETNTYWRKQEFRFLNSTDASLFVTNRADWTLLSVPNPVEVLPGPTNALWLTYLNTGPGVNDITVGYTFGAAATTGGGGDPAPPETASTLTNGLVAFWEFEDVANTTAADSHTGGFDLTPSVVARFAVGTPGVVGNTWTNGANGSYGTLRNTDASLRMPATGSYSMAGWYRRLTSGGLDFFMGHRSSTAGQYGVALRRISGNMGVYWSTDGSTATAQYDSGVAHGTDWIFFAVNVDMDTGNIDVSFTVRGALSVMPLTSVVSGATLHQSTEDIALYGTANDGAHIRLDQVGFWNRKLTNNEIERMFTEMAYIDLDDPE
jgi:hypothetical protein